MRHRGKIRLYNWIGGNEMKKCKLCKMTALFCAAFLTVCAFLWNMQSVQGDGDTALYYWGFENTTADAAGTLTSGSEGSFTAGRQGQALNVAKMALLSRAPYRQTRLWVSPWRPGFI